MRDDSPTEGVPVFASLLTIAFLGALVAGIAARRSRRRFVEEGAFRCRIRAGEYPSAVWPRLRRSWSRRMWAIWADDVLIVRRGPGIPRVIPLRAQVAAYGVYTLSAHQVRRCGSHPIAVGLRVWDGSRLEVAVDQEARLELVGPYLAAAVTDLPKAPVPRRRN
jgi:hypothetical protein